MNAHYLAIHYESYDSTTVFGVFDTLAAARAHLEAEASAPSASSAARFAEVEEWDGATVIAVHERNYLTPMLWETKRYDTPDDRTITV